MRYALLLFGMLLISGSSSGQFYNSGQEPFSLKWQQIESDNYQVVFHEGTDSLAFIFDKYLHYSLQKVTTTLHHNPRKFSTVIHANSILSNGFVSWAPRRMEIVSTPPPDASSEPWLYHLALHETRHIVQLDKIYGKTMRFGNILFGQQAIGFKLLLTPLWFLEGDAVYAETAYSNAGRGRQSSFYRPYLAHIAENNGSIFSYDKWLLGSYKDFVPNHYSFGYQMVGYTNMKYGSNVWSDALISVSRKLFFTFPFHRSVKQSTNQTTKKIFNEVVAYHDSLWKNIELNDEINTHKTLVSNDFKNNDYIEYTYPYRLNDSVLFSLKKSLIHRPRLIAEDLNSNAQKRLHTPGIITSRVSYSEKQILWSEYRAHPRWEYVDYSEVWLFDLAQQKARKISDRTRFFNPIEYANNSIAAIENNVKGENYITIIDKQGNSLHSIQTPSTLELREICRGDSTEIFARCASPRGMVILKYSATHSEPDTVLGPVHNDISNLAYNEGMLYFTKTKNYRESIFAISISSGNAYWVSKSTFGLSDLSYNKQLVATQYSSTGSVPVVVSIEPTLITNLAYEEKPLFYNESKFEENSLEGNLTNQKRASVEYGKYIKTKNLFNFHSWAPVYFNPMDIMDGSTTIYPGLTLISQNLTNTLVSSLGYSYNKTHGAHAHFEYMGWYPKIMAGFDYGNEYSIIQHGPLAPNFLTYSNEPRLSARLRIRLPYTFTSGNIVTAANLGFSFIYSNNWMWDYANESYQQWSTAIAPYISFYSLTRRAHRDIRPRYGVQLYASTLSSPQSKMLGGSSFFKGWLYLPGFANNHSLLITGQGETQSPKQYVRSLRYTPVRGYERSLAKSVITAAIDYTFPAAYPDLALGSIIYLKRLVGNIFNDNAMENRYTRTDQGLVPQKEVLHSFGVDLTADFHLFRTSYPLNIGYRGGYRLNEGDFFHGIIFSMSLESLTGYIPSQHNATLNF